jgi:hypothetical protein
MNNLEERIKEIEKQLQELKEQLTEENNKYKRKRLDYGDYYWFLNNLGEAVMAFDDYNEYEDNFKYLIGNYFETEKEAKNYKEKLLIEQELKDIAMELNKGEKIDWENSYQKKHYLGFNYNINEINFFTNINFKSQGIIYCLDENFKDVAIKRIGKERLTKYLKGELD